MSAVLKDLTSATSSIKIDSYPASEKIYVQGSRPDIRVPMRRITLSDTPAQFGAEKNPPLYVYDTSEKA
jgi:phosphomethylpyrimidine synthase